MQACVNCGKTHALQDSYLCGFCTKQYCMCSRCQKPYLRRKAGLGQSSTDAIAICIPCLMLARGICGECGHAIFNDVITQRVGRRGARINNLCSKCFRKSTPLLHTDLPNLGQEVSLWKNDKDLLEGTSKLGIVLSAYSAIIPDWASPTDAKLLVALCTALPKAAGQCYISFYPSEILLEKNKKPPVVQPLFRFEGFAVPVLDKARLGSAGSILAKEMLVCPYNCHSATLLDYWPSELYSYAKSEDMLYRHYPSPLRGKSAEVVTGTLLLSSSRLQAIASTIDGASAEGGN